MKYIRKIAASSLIMTLAFFVGSFCLHPMSAQAMEASSAMAMDVHDMSGGEDEDVVQENDAPISAWNLCVLNCASNTPQAVAAKQFSVDFPVDFFAGIPDQETLRLSESSSDPDYFSDVSLSPPDILSSVFKKE